MIKDIGKAVFRLLGLAPRRVGVSRRVGFWDELVGNIRYQRAFRRHPEIDIPRLRRLRHLHAQKDRCFIIGNGPSLNQLDLLPLGHEITFGFNAVFLNAEKMGFAPSYYVVADTLVSEDRHEQINRYRGPRMKFFPLERASLIRPQEDVTFFWQLYADPYPQFSTDISEGIFGGYTVTYHALQIAYYMGFRQAILIGMDHNWTVSQETERVAGRAGCDELTSQDDDPNHFHPDYFGKGYRWHDPAIDMMEAAYSKARQVWEADGRQILNATPGGKLEVFNRTDYNGLFPGIE